MAFILIKIIRSSESTGRSGKLIGLSDIYTVFVHFKFVLNVCVGNSSQVGLFVDHGNNLDQLISWLIILICLSNISIICVLNILNISRVSNCCFILNATFNIALNSTWGASFLALVLLLNQRLMIYGSLKLLILSI